MSISDAIKNYLRDSGESMRSLSLRAGLGEKAVATILNIRGLQPRRTTVVALSQATGIDLAACQGDRPLTYAELIHRKENAGDTRGANRLRWLVRSAGWVPETESVCRREVIEFLDRHEAVAFGLTQGSYSTYKCEAIAAATSGHSRQRRKNISDIDGLYAEIHEVLKAGDLPNWKIGLSGSFLVFLDEMCISPAQITTETLADYYVHRLATSSKSEQKCRNHVVEIAGLLKTFASHPELSRFGFAIVAHPFGPNTGRYGIGDAAIAALMSEFDRCVAPWALGEMSRDGLTYAEFITSLDRQEAALSDKKALLRKRRAERSSRPGQKPATTTKANDETLSEAGFLTAGTRWSTKTLSRRRGYIASLAKAIVSSTDVVPETMEELLDPDFVETAIDVIKDTNEGEFPSGYVGSLLECVRKIARGYQCRSPEDIARISDLIRIHGWKHKGIAPRNRAKLRQFNDTRIQKTIDLGDLIIADVNAEIDRRRKAHRKRASCPAKARGRYRCRTCSGHHGRDRP